MSRLSSLPKSLLSLRSTSTIIHSSQRSILPQSSSVLLLQRPLSTTSSKLGGSTTAKHSNDGHHDDHHHHHEEWNEPSGYLFGHKPGAKRPWYWWEPLWYGGFYGSIALYLVFHAYSPKQNYEERTKLEAHRRLVERGEKFEYPLPPNYSPLSK